MSSCCFAPLRAVVRFARSCPALSPPLESVPWVP